MLLDLLVTVTALLELYLLWSSRVMDLWSPSLLSSLEAEVFMLSLVMLRWVGSFPVDLDPSRALEMTEKPSCSSAALRCGSAVLRTVIMVTRGDW